MFKKLQKSVFDKSKLLSTNISKRRVNKTPCKKLYPNRTNLTFANIIVNMSSTPTISSIDNWNNAYFKTELYNNFFSNKSNNGISNYKGISHTKDNYTKVLSIIVNGIISLKSNEFLTYTTKLIEIMVFLRDNIDNNNKFIGLNQEINKDLVMFIYQTYFQIFSNDSIISIILKNDLKNSMIIFQNYHLIYIFYILTGIVYIHYNLKRENKPFYTFLKQFIKNEKCNDSKCTLCNQINLVEKSLLGLNSQNQSISPKRASVIKISGKDTKKNNNNYNINSLNKAHYIRRKKKYNIINNSNDNIIRKKNITIESNNNNKEKSFNTNIFKYKIENNYYSNLIKNDRINKKMLDIKKCKNDINFNKKKTFYSQIIKANEKEKKQFFNDSFSSKEKSSSKNKYQIQKTDKNLLDNTRKILIYNEKYDYNLNDKKYFTEINDNRNKRKIKDKEFLNLIDEIKIKLCKNNSPIKKAETNFDNKNKKIDKIENTSINTISNINSDISINISRNQKLIHINKKDLLEKNKKIKINATTEIKNKKDKNQINMDKIDNVDKKKYMEISYNLNKSSNLIKENINAIERDIRNFKDHNNYIKQQLYCLTKKY